MTLGRSLLWFIIGVIWVCAAFAIVYAQNSELEQRATGGNTMADNDKRPLTERMNNLAGELAGLDPNDPRRAEIVNELSQLSLLSAKAKGRPTNG